MSIDKPLLLCHKKIEIPNTNGIAVTYCMRDMGHEGKCSPLKDKKEAY